MNAMQPPQSVEEIKAGLETTEKGGVRQSIRNCLTVFQRDPLLSGAIAYNILTDRKDIILFHTGLRISEFCGLTISEIEFGEMRIKVDHQLQRTAQMQYVIEEPKTDKGIRYVPMTEAVAACFRRIIANRKTPKVEPMVEGYAGFLFLDKNDMPMVALHWEKYMEHIIQKYNRIYRIQMPKVTPHVCRHTFCSNMAKSGMNPKTLQYIMGHADISITLNTYTHVNFDDAKEEVYRIANS